MRRYYRYYTDSAEGMQWLLELCIPSYPIWSWLETYVKKILIIKTKFMIICININATEIFMYNNKKMKEMNQMIYLVVVVNSQCEHLCEKNAQSEKLENILSRFRQF